MNCSSEKLPAFAQNEDQHDISFRLRGNICKKNKFYNY